MAEDRERQRDMPMEDEDARREHSEDEYQDRSTRSERRVEERTPQTTTAADNRMEDQLEPLFEDEEARKFRTRWLTIQSKFVDDPRDSVKQADDLVADIIKSVTMNFADRRISLEKQWNIGENISTEDMRVTLKRYRAFLERLLALES